MDFIIIENDQGLVVIQVPVGKRAEHLAVENGGVIVDPGPYKTFDDAYDAMQLIPIKGDPEI